MPTRIMVSTAWSRLGWVGVVARETPPGEYVDAASFAKAETALQAAALDLRDAVDTFAAMREQQEAGHHPEVGDNVETFAAKYKAAVDALTALGVTTSPAPTGRADDWEVRGATHPSGAGEDLPHDEPAGATAAGTPPAATGDGAAPPRDAAPAGSPADALARLLEANGRGTAELRAVRLLKGLNDAGYHVLRESEISAVATAGAVS